MPHTPALTYPSLVYRLPCPALEALVRLVATDLPDPDLLTHLAHCELCRGEVAAIAKVWLASRHGFTLYLPQQGLVTLIKPDEASGQPPVWHRYVRRR
jgi:hypothetical protein